MNTFGAILTRTISFQTIDGLPRTLPAGTSLLVAQITTPTFSTNSRGQMKQERVGTFVGALGDDSFDLSSEEFATLQ